MNQGSHSFPPVTDAVSRALEAAQLDDEPVTAEERREIEQARKEVVQGEVSSTDELRGELGIE